MTLSATESDSGLLLPPDNEPTSVVPSTRSLADRAALLARMNRTEVPAAGPLPWLRARVETDRFWPGRTVVALTVGVFPVIAFLEIEGFGTGG